MLVEVAQETRDSVFTALKVANAIPLIHQIGGFVLEAACAYALGLGRPKSNKKLFDIVDHDTKTGWSIKSIKHDLHANANIEYVIQRANAYGKSEPYGFGKISARSDPQTIGKVVLSLWNQKVNADAKAQGVINKRKLILVRDSLDNVALFEDELSTFSLESLTWRWTSHGKAGLQGLFPGSDETVLRWHPSGTQLFERVCLPETFSKVSLRTKRLTIDQLITKLNVRRATK